MKNQFSKVGQVKPNIKKFLKLDELQNLYKSFIEEAYNVMQTDSSLSDYLYFEAFKLKKQMIRVEADNSKLRSSL
ncbi:Lacal_2735 family protein [Formosa sediminum]|uniref:Lacal_2735 family protein n=1 Tax=Formosa sediminum TaxID=2594004 RepID=A0A516GLR5_9FLAO|nr:Lacal_2735 family protein [Formosa sediminum]QDO92464.1 Lacal_2735 family protein [Formosa sediminum]